MTTPESMYEYAWHGSGDRRVVVSIAPKHSSSMG